MTHITLITTGGTIASRSVSEGGPVVAAVAGQALLDSLHDLPAGLEVVVEDFRALGSYALDLPTVHSLVARIRAALAIPGCAGVVVTHGTDTMEETAFLADLLIDSDKPVVFTGAQRHAGEADTDGPRNIADALTVAAAEQARGLGAMILFEGDVHAARDASKTHTSRVDTFRSAGLGKLGEVDRGALHLYRRPAERLVLADAGLEERVELIKLSLGARPHYLEWCAAHDIRGVVLEAFGRGNAPQGYASIAARLVERSVPVVVASRCAEGRTAAIYGADSGGATLEQAGVIFAGTLSAIKARLMLCALLGAGASMDEMRAAFAAKSA
ncbi:asparaginase [Candidimonas nitroreducens]|uniref:L-asparaginase n=1 Tax=Candidimonas nitroreducens TaxID=683354 RepID=A0A225MIN4_9BURK|nr:asparaginase [Candidimonas nitroreducens]OWT60173.1 L-asparaginase [Candidimonas nitroreducens]